jgi:hypothetical protein
MSTQYVNGEEGEDVYLSVVIEVRLSVGWCQPEPPRQVGGIHLSVVPATVTHSTPTHESEELWKILSQEPQYMTILPPKHPYSVAIQWQAVVAK